MGSLAGSLRGGYEQRYSRRYLRIRGLIPYAWQVVSPVDHHHLPGGETLRVALCMLRASAKSRRPV